ncbi:MAG TPA: hypothetical protein VIY51_23435 [Xanthobacteraceae bacterium]
MAFTENISPCGAVYWPVFSHVAIRDASVQATPPPLLTQIWAAFSQLADAEAVSPARDANANAAKHEIDIPLMVPPKLLVRRTGAGTNGFFL